MASKEKFNADIGLKTDADLQVDGNVTVTGDFTVNGTSTTINATTTSVEDNMLELANSNTSSDTIDIGIYGNYDDGLSDGGASEYTGLFRDASDSTWKLFDGLEEAPTTTVNTSGTGYTLADLQVGDLTATTLTATNSLTGSSITYPTTDGTNGQVLTTDGSGTLSFTDVSGGISNIVEDTTPQLGGDLDLNSNNITGTGDINVTGTVTADGLTVDGTADISSSITVGTLDTIIAENNIRFKPTGAAYIDHNTVGQDINFRVSNASTLDTTALTINSSGNLIMTAGGTIRAGGVNDLILDAGESGTPDIYLQSGGATKVKIEGSNGNVGIGCSPEKPLDVQSGTANSNIAHFTGSHSTRGMTIATYNADNFDDAGVDLYGLRELRFSTNVDEAMRIDSAGRVLINATSSFAYSGADDLQIGSTSDAAMGMSIVTTNTGIGRILFGDSDSTITGQIEYTHNGDFLTFATGGTTRVRIDSDGIKFGADSAAANGLDDYEEGTWTPTVTGGTAGYQVRTGRYTKIGNIVRLRCAIKLNSWSGATTVTISGLPFASITGTYDHDWGACHIEGKPNNAIWTAGSSGSDIFFRRQDVTNADTPMNHTDIDANTGIMFTVVYQTSA